MDHARRRLLSGLLASGAMAATPSAIARSAVPRVPPPSQGNPPPPDAKFSRPLRVPGQRGLLAEVRLAGTLDLTASVGSHALFPGLATALWNYTGKVAGLPVDNPLLIARQGGEIDVVLHNRIGRDTTIHWHGMMVDEANDGSGLHPVRHGAQRRYRFPVRNRAGLYWYHAHPHFHTGRQVHQGLAGLLLVEDAEELALRGQLGLPWGERDIPLLIADKQLGRNNALAYGAGADDWIGNRVLVNWTPEPFLDAPQGLYRFRMANLSNARMLRPAFVHRGQPLPFHLLGTDGGLLERAWPLRDLFLAPAQRADVLVDLSQVPAGERVLLRSLAYEPMENDAAATGEDPMLEHPGAPAMGAPMDLMELRVRTGTHAIAPVPAPLSRLAAPPVDSAPTRRFTLRISDAGRWLINDWNYLLDGHGPRFEVRRGSRETWEFRNAFRSMPHPLHLHGFAFRVLAREGSPAQLRASAAASGGRTPQDLGLLDTVVVWPGETVRIAIDFAQPCRGPQVYMLHCHNLEHEDQGMMVAFAVVD
jgi:FtsP/CotA-like multicopper oxidase with cupredoxin domain